MSELYNKYKVEKVEGLTDPEAQYFVLRVDRDRHAQVALAAYAESVREDNQELSAELEAWLARVRA